MRRGAQNMPVFKARGTIEGHKDGGRGDLKGQMEQVFTSRTGCQTWEELQRDMPSMQKKWKNSWVKLQ